MDKVELQILLIEELRDRGSGTAVTLSVRLDTYRGIEVNVQLVDSSLADLKKEGHVFTTAEWLGFDESHDLALYGVQPRAVYILRYD